MTLKCIKNVPKTKKPNNVKKNASKIVLLLYLNSVMKYDFVFIIYVVEY